MNSKYGLIGKKFERLTVIKRAENSKSGQTRWFCKCDCGNETIVWGNHLRSGHTKSCGCIQKESVKRIKHYKKHGLHGIRLYRIWNGIKNRTNLSNKNIAYKNYSGRGITICEEWKEFMPFYNWAINNGYQDNLTIDRIDVNGNYEPKNCRWATMKEQQNNKRNNRFITYNGEKHTISEWKNIYNLSDSVVNNKLYKKCLKLERVLDYGK